MSLLPDPRTKRLFYVFLLSLAWNLSPATHSALHAQVVDSTAQATPPATVVDEELVSLKDLRRGPRSALLWSIIPGGGQVYNRRWWKVPLVYGGLLGIIAYADFNQTQYRRFVTVIENRCLGAGNVITPPFENCITTPDEFPQRSTEAVRQARDNANRARQNAFIGIAIVYILQGVEAYTDAHLKTFDISDDLSIHLGPVSSPGYIAGYGLTVPLGAGLKARRELATLHQLTGR